VAATTQPAVPNRSGAQPGGGTSHTFRAPEVHDSWIGAFLAIAPLAPILAAVLTVVVYLAPWQIGPFGWLLFDAHAHPLVGSLVNLFGAWALLALLYRVLGFSRVDRASPTTFDDVCATMGELNAMFDAVFCTLERRPHDEVVAGWEAGERTRHEVT
jgi:hypothetical protein